MSDGDKEKVKKSLPYVSLALSLVFFLGSGIIQLNAWNLNQRVNTLDGRIEQMYKTIYDISSTLSGIVSIVKANSVSISKLVDYELSKPK